MKRIYLISVVFLTLISNTQLFATPPPGRQISTEHQASTISISETSKMNIRLTVKGRSVTVTLIDSPTTRDFLTLLPLTLKLDDYAGTEKIAYLPRKLSVEGAPSGIDPSVGDITYYAPWGNLALFYKEFGYAKGLIKLGSIDEGVEVFNAPGSISVTIEHSQK